MKKPLLSLLFFVSAAPLYSAEENTIDQSELFEQSEHSTDSNGDWADAYEEDWAAYLSELSAQCSSYEQEKSNVSAPSYNKKKEEHSDSDSEDCYSGFSLSALHALEKFHQEHDFSVFTTPGKYSKNHAPAHFIASRMLTKTSPKRESHQRSPKNPFEIQSPDVLGHLPLGSKTDLRTKPPVYRKQMETRAPRHSQTKRQSTAINHVVTPQQLVPVVIAMVQGKIR